MSTIWLTFYRRRGTIAAENEESPMDKHERAESTEAPRDIPWTELHAAPLPPGVPWGRGGRVLREVPYASPAGFRPLLLDLHLPERRPYPAVVWIHGGAFRMGSRTLLPPILERADPFGRLVASGIAVASIDYRLSAEARFPAQLHDVKAAIRWLRGRGQEVGIDPDRIAVWGESAGGHLATMATVTSGIARLEGAVGLTGVSSAVSAGVDWYGPTDFAAMDRDAPADSAMTHDAPDSPESELIGAPVQDRPDLVALANPCSYARRDIPPILVDHGTRDRLVPYGQSVRLVDALRAVGADVTFVTEKGADHVFDGAPDEEEIVSRAVEFLRHHLRVVNE
jgi:acetyl esterase/lipase